MRGRPRLPLFLSLVILVSGLVFFLDLVREAPDAPAKFRLGPRKDWYVNNYGRMQEVWLDR